MSGKLTTEETDVLWDTYLASDDESDVDRAKQELINNYVPLVTLIAKKVHRKLPSSIDQGDLISDGYFGLVDAIQKFDPSKGFKFETYASSRIRGEITDKLRDYDWVSRYFRLKFKEVSQTRDLLLQELQREPTTSEIADRLGWDVSEVERMQAGFNSSFHINLDERMKDSTHEFFKLSELIADQSASDLSYDMERQELVERLLAALQFLKPRESNVLYLYLYEGLNFSEIAEVLGMTTGRISQIHDSALTTLRRKLILL
jgi:RNA polymerase sigma factor for flagellar operon FliA